MAKKPTQAMFVDDEHTEETPKKASKPQQQTPPTPALPSGENFLELPSKGLLGYPSTVTYRDILVKDEEKLSTATGETYARTLNSVLKGILNNCEWFEQMTIHDRDFALVWLWANNYESKKSVDIKCSSSSCGNEEVKQVDLTELDVSDVNPKIPAPMEFPLKIGSTVYLRLNTVGDEIEIENFLSKGSNREKYAFDHLMMVASIQTELNMPFEQKVRWVGENVRGNEMGYVRKFHQYFRYGVNDKIEHTCSECGEVTVGQLPFRAEDVLFPTVSGDFADFLRFDEDNGDQSK